MGCVPGEESKTSQTRPYSRSCASSCWTSTWDPMRRCAPAVRALFGHKFLTRNNLGITTTWSPYKHGPAGDIVNNRMTYLTPEYR